ncbi:hypothetical protein EVAR_372_1 [Eumeta japonica]|uniref:Uncharacterized protein n=1 Tax=Eumeta variegata TaxID=151549 RepID=A0A4C1SA45_EUMVA|nr:hypothetical protein EVAR_372_1 [Eumeta japonica]
MIAAETYQEHMASERHDSYIFRVGRRPLEQVRTRLQNSYSEYTGNETRPEQRGKLASALGLTPPTSSSSVRMRTRIIKPATDANVTKYHIDGGRRH